MILNGSFSYCFESFFSGFWIQVLRDIEFANIFLQSIAFHSFNSASEVLNQGTEVRVCDFLHLMQIFVGDKVWH